MKETIFIVSALAMFGLAFSGCVVEKNTSSAPMATKEEKLVQVSTLPKAISDSSGLILINDIIWTHNDSAGKAELFELNSTFPKGMRTIPITKQDNNDWEDITQDDNHIYIGDFGNNNGNRKNLSILKINKEQLTKKNAVKAEKIEFSYPDQKGFDSIPYQHNFDCEAMLSYQGSLFLFSKNYGNNRCKLYRLPKNEGKYKAKLIGEMDTKGTITGASLDPENNILALLGYNATRVDGKMQFKPFVWLLYDFKGTNFFAGKSKQINFDSQLQLEGICYDKNGVFYISSEAQDGELASLYSFDARKWLQ